MLVRPSRRTLEAFEATRFDVARLGAFVCERALPAADFDFAPVLVLVIVFDALDAAFGLVTRTLAAIAFSWWWSGRGNIAHAPRHLSPRTAVLIGPAPDVISSVTFEF